MVAGAFALSSVRASGQTACLPSAADQTVTSRAVLNTYYPGPEAGLGDTAAGSRSIAVDASAMAGGPALGAGDLVLIVQIQGAEIQTGGEAMVGGAYGDGPGGSDRAGVLDNAEAIAGDYEFNVADGPVMAGVLPLREPTRHRYVSHDAVVDNGDGTGRGYRRYQVVRVPRFNNLSIEQPGGVLTAEPWNGRTGGIVAVDVSGTLTVNGAIDVTGLGFRGGAPTIPPGMVGTETNTPTAAVKGEGNAGSPSRLWSRAGGLVVGPVALFGSSEGQGAPGNAGGTAAMGASDAGGGGGGGAAPGGPGAVGVGVGPGPDADRARGGEGYQDVDRILFGGGGGSGSLDDPAVREAVSGQAGGGIIYLRAVSLTGSGVISADGDDGGLQPQEGGGGGGGGGSLFVHTESEDLLGLTIRATGGDGGSSQEPLDGGGGGGGGGFVVLAHPTMSIMASIDVGGGMGGNAPGGSGAGGGGGFQQIGAPPVSSSCPPPTIAIGAPSGVVQLEATTASGTTTGVPDGASVSVTVTGPGGYSAGCTAVVTAGVWSCPAEAIDGLVPGSGYTASATVTAGTLTASDSAGFDVVQCLALSEGDPCTTHAGASGICRGPAATLTCCAGCWDGSTCQAGDAAAACGQGGALCAACDDANECTADACTAASCANTVRPAGSSCSTGGTVCDGLSAPACVACVDDAPAGATDSGCAAGAPVCDTSEVAPVCVGCLVNGDCPSGICSGGACVPCADTAAGSGIDQGCASALPVCDESGAAPVCRGCLVDGHCPSGAVCGAGFVCTMACTSDTHCAASPGTPVCDTSAGQCVTCLDDMTGASIDSGCDASAPLCDTSGGSRVCVVCLNDTVGGQDLGCSAAQPACDTSAASHACVPCEDSAAAGSIDNGCTAAAPACNTALPAGPACRQCVVAGDCPGTGAECSPAGLCVLGCSSNSDCAGTPPTPICDPGSAVCVACLVTADCRGTQICTPDRVCRFPDSDRDGVHDDVDVDDDNDGILDTAEHDGQDLSLDSDMDGVQDFQDPSSVVCPDTGGDGICDTLPLNVDFDQDGVANQIDLDADGDGLADVIEAGGEDGANRDGVIDGFADANRNGYADALEAMALPLPNTDGLSAPDFLDLDADADGVTDTHEAGGVDTDGNGRPDGALPGSALPDSDGNGLADSLTGSGALALTDTDGDGLPDYRSPDSDADAVADRIESRDTDASGAAPLPSNIDSDADGLDDLFDPDCADAAACGGRLGSKAAMPDLDADGKVDYRDVDDDADGIPTRAECRLVAGCVASDADGSPDYLDIDSDGDGLLDLVEGHDTDFNGVQQVGPANADSDGDGLDDAYDPDCATATDCSGVLGVRAPLPDTDGDALANYRDPDDDADGRATADEVQDAMSYTGPAADPTDVDADVLRNWYDVNSDGDGLDDLTEIAGGLDKDGNGILDYLDPNFGPLDSDGDGIPDVVECPGVFPLTPLACRDSDGDTAPDYLDVDDDNDGVLTKVEYAAPDFLDGDPGNDRDADEDDVQNHLDLDSDNDGIPDLWENGSGALDADGDGRVDQPLDQDRDGLLSVFDANDVDPNNTMTREPTNTDGLGSPDLLDLDSDNDGISDLVEAEGLDADANGQVDDFADADGDGLADLVDPDSGGQRLPIPDSDHDDTADYQAIDGDGDEVLDAIEGHDANADGIADVMLLGLDADGDGLDDGFDASEGGSPASLPDNDSDSVPDYRDPDDDADSLPTSMELRIGTGPVPADTDSDGVPNYLDPDDDEDTLPTATEYRDGVMLSGGPNQDVDRDGTPNWLDTDSDGDGLLDQVEGRGDIDGDGDPDYLDPLEPPSGMPPVDPGTPPLGPLDPTPGPPPPNVGIAGGALCSAAWPGSSTPGSCWLIVLVLLGWRSFRRNPRG
ncbi:MAG: hypothetical protein MJD61_07000 [Proteobacteria bacterium]|nr:hypothetical protein [Pseudomonadota bacterium]